MLSLTITLSMVLKGLRAIIDEFGPDHVAGDDGIQCVYIKDGVAEGFIEPVCIVGTLFDRWGMLRLLSSPHGSGDRTDAGVCQFANFGSTVTEALTGYGVSMDREAVRFLRAVQVRQDKGTPWGLAFEETIEETLRERGLSVSPYDTLLRSL